MMRLKKMDTDKITVYRKHWEEIENRLRKLECGQRGHKLVPATSPYGHDLMDSALGFNYVYLKCLNCGHRESVPVQNLTDGQRGMYVDLGISPKCLVKENEPKTNS